MKLTANQTAPAFRTQDVFGANIDLSSILRNSQNSQKILLTFFRSAGCPVCNFHVSQLMGYAPRWQEQGLTMIAVYESTKDNLLGYVQDSAGRRRFPFTIIADPERRLYELYKVESSFGKMMGGFMKSTVIGMAKNGSDFRQSATKPKQDGSMTRIGADFLINERGVIHTAHYGSHIGDHLSIEVITSFAALPAQKAIAV